MGWSTPIAAIAAIVVVLSLAACSRAPEPESTGARELAGSTSCRECHPQFYRSWETSWHGQALRSVGAGVDLPPGEAMAGGVRCRVGDGVVVEETAEGARHHAIEYVVGGKDVTYLLTELPRGRLQVLPVALDTATGEWFDTTASAVRHFEGIDDEALSWRDRALTFNTACSSCHVSHLSTTYDVATDTYATTWSEPGISCEGCHGPGAEHARACAGPDGCATDPLIVEFDELTPQQINDACLSCHARLIPLTDEFTPGDRFFDHFDLVTLEHPDYHPDGRDLGENYTTSWWLSPCVAASDLTCLHCHTSSGRFRFSDGPDEACLPCHAPRAETGAAAAGHAGAGPDSRCVDCHMATTTFARMRRSDHSMRPPGAQGAAELVSAARRGDWTCIADLEAYLASPGRDEITAASLVRLLDGSSDPAAQGILRSALSDVSPLVRSSAAGALGHRLAEEDLPALLAATGDDYRLVRVRAARALAGLDETRVPAELRGDWLRANTELDASLQPRADVPGTHMARGNLAMDRREFASAVAAFGVAAKLDPAAVEPRVNGALAHALAGDEVAAEALLREALALAPGDATVNLNLGLLLGGQGRNAEAAEVLHRAVDADPESAVAWFNLCVAVGAGEPAAAVPHCRRAVALEPGESRYAEAVEFYSEAGSAAEGGT